jgi:hypothetical protein
VQEVHTKKISEFPPADLARVRQARPVSHLETLPMPPNKVKAPGAPGTFSRVASTEQELAEATACPFSMFDGTTCNGPECPSWHARTEYHPNTGAPLLTSIDCDGYVKPRSIGHVKPQQEGARS